MPMEVSHVWLGKFPTEAALTEYFEETYADDEETLDESAEADDELDDSPINRFAADQGVGFYDHDWVERNFDASGDLRQLMHRCSYADDYIDDVIRRAQSRGVTSVNTFVMADRAQIPEPQSVEGDGYTLWYMGTVTCNV